MRTQFIRERARISEVTAVLQLKLIHIYPRSFKKENSFEANDKMLFKNAKLRTIPQHKLLKQTSSPNIRYKICKMSENHQLLGD